MEKHLRVVLGGFRSRFNAGPCSLQLADTVSEKVTAGLFCKEKPWFGNVLVLIKVVKD